MDGCGHGDGQQEVVVGRAYEHRVLVDGVDAYGT